MHSLIQVFFLALVEAKKTVPLGAVKIFTQSQLIEQSCFVNAFIK